MCLRKGAKPPGDVVVNFKRCQYVLRGMLEPCMCCCESADSVCLMSSPLLSTLPSILLSAPTTTRASSSSEMAIVPWAAGMYLVSS